MIPNEDKMLASIRLHLDSTVNAMDAHTASRLNRARQQALDQGLAQAGQLRWLRPMLALASCAAVILALGLTLRTPEVTAPVTNIQDADDFELLAGSEELEMIENLEFYAWLEQQSLEG